MARPAGFQPKRHQPDALPLLVKRTAWAIRIDHQTHPFESLSEMAKWFTSNHVEDDTFVTLYRNDKRIYTGPWGRVL